MLLMMNGDGDGDDGGGDDADCNSLNSLCVRVLYMSLNSLPVL